MLAFVATAAWADSPPRGWPAFLPSPDGFPADLVAAVERTWTDRTLSRTVRGPAVRAPFDLYSALIDAPDVTAVAARYRNFSRDDVRRVSDDVYEAQDHDGSRGYYRVLARERNRRVIFSWGENSSPLLGKIRGDALTVLTFEPEGGRIRPVLTAYVRIDNRFIAAVARALVVPFGGIADRKLREGVVTGTRVAEWAATQPEEFCDWLGQSGLPRARRAPIESLISGCARNGGGEPRRDTPEKLGGPAHHHAGVAAAWTKREILGSAGKSFATPTLRQRNVRPGPPG